MSEVFVETAWLRDRLDDPRVRIIDARSTPHGGTVAMPSGREQYASGHLPGAVHLDYADDLHDLATPYATRVAPADRFAAVVSANGIGNDDTVIAYDDGTVPYAARMVWMLRYYGHRDAKILAGGITAWRDAGNPLTADVPVPKAAMFTAKPHPAIRATRAEVELVALGSSDAQLLETQRDTTYAQRDRDIRNAVRLSANALLVDADGGRIADRATLDRLIDERGLDRHRRTIVSCGSGVSASGAYLALLEAGFTDLAVYDGSWMEWAHDALPTQPKA